MNKKVDPYPTIPNLAPAPKPKLGIGDRVKEAFSKPKPPPPAPVTPAQRREGELKYVQPRHREDFNEVLNEIDKTNFKVKR